MSIQKLFLASTLIALSFQSAANSQSQYPKNMLINRVLMESLSLSEEQQELWTELNVEMAQKRSNLFLNGGEAAVTELQTELSRKYYESLNPTQQKIIGYWNVWLKTGGRQSSSVFGTQFTAEMLSLTDTQRKKMDSLDKRVQDEIKGLENVALQDQDDLFTRTSQKMIDELLPHQLEAFNEVVGENFEFGKSTLQDLTMAKKVIDLVPDDHRGQSTMQYSNTGKQSAFRPLLLIHSSESFEDEPKYVPMLALLASEEIADELKLSSMQKQRIKSNVEKIESKFKQIVKIEIDRTADNEIRLVASDVSGEVLGISDEEWNSFERFDDILNESQLKRARQLYAQLVAKLRSPEGLLLFHPDWTKYLVFSDTQKSSFAQCKDEYLTQKKELATQLAENVQEAVLKGYEECLALLSKEQMEIWNSKVGVLGQVKRKSNSNN